MGSRARDTIANQGSNRKPMDAQEGGGGGQSPPMKSQYQQQQLLAEELRKRLRFSDLEGVTPVDSVMLGLYQLNDEQSRVYGAFVEVGLDTHTYPFDPSSHAHLERTHLTHHTPQASEYTPLTLPE